MEENQAKRILEALLLVSEKPLMIAQARETLEQEVQDLQVRNWLLELVKEYENGSRGIRIVEVAEGFQLITDPGLASYVTKLTKRVRTVKLSKPALETLAIIAYRQPLTRVEVEQIRGVDVTGVLDTLLRLDLIRITGRKEAVGRPLLYGTTRQFLDHFGLKNLAHLPSLEELTGKPGELKEVTGISTTASDLEVVEGEEEVLSSSESAQAEAPGEAPAQGREP